MSIRNRVFPHIRRVLQGDTRLAQLASFTHNRLAPKREVMSGQPTHLSFFITSRCNFRCDMCPTHSKKVPNRYIHTHREAPDMSMELFCFVLNLYPNVIRVPLIGVGEPLLNPHFFDMVREAVKRRLIVDTISNGYILDAYISDIVRSGIDRICISVNGHSADEFHRMTGNPSIYYSRILRNVETLMQARGSKKTKPRIDLSFIIDRHNYLYMRDMIEIGENLAVDGVYLAHFQASPYPGFAPEERCLFTDDLGVREELIYLMSKKYHCYIRWPYLLRRPEGERTVCRWPFSIILIDGGGNVGGCPMQMPNIHENGKIYDKDPWNNQYFRDLRRRHLKGTLFWPCKSCVECAGVKPKRAVKG